MLLMRTNHCCRFYNPDSQRLQQYCQSLADDNGGNLPSGLPHRAEVVRSYFYDRVFGNPTGPAPMEQHEADDMMVEGGRYVTRFAARQIVLKKIEELVRFVILPTESYLPSGGFSASQAGSEPFSNQLEGVDSRPSSQVQSLSGESSTIGLPIDQSRNVSHQTVPDQVLLRQSDANQLRNARQGQQLPLTHMPPPGWPSPTSTHQSDIDQAFPAQSFAGSRHMGVGTTRQGVPQRPPSTAPLAQAPLGAYAGQMYYGNEFTGPMQPIIQPAYRFQQPTYISPHQSSFVNSWQQPLAQGPPSTFTGAFGHPAPANGLAPLPPLPIDRAVRPPATNRIATLYNRAWQAQEAQVAPAIAIVQNPEWQNRYGVQPAVAHDVRTLPYRVGSDDMYPGSNGVASVRFQNLTRYDTPSRDVVLDPENMPFENTAGSAKPSEWGVMKIGNVSNKA